MTLAAQEDDTRRVQSEGVGAMQRIRTDTSEGTNNNDSTGVGMSAGEWTGEHTAPPTPPSPGEGDSNGAPYFLTPAVVARALF